MAPSLCGVPLVMRVRFGMDDESLDVSRDVWVALEHAERGLALVDPMQVDGAVDRGDDFRVDFGRL